MFLIEVGQSITIAGGYGVASAHSSGVVEPQHKIDAGKVRRRTRPQLVVEPTKSLRARHCSRLPERVTRAGHWHEALLARRGSIESRGSNWGALASRWRVGALAIWHEALLTQSIGTRLCSRVAARLNRGGELHCNCWCALIPAHEAGLLAMRKKKRKEKKKKERKACGA